MREDGFLSVVPTGHDPEAFARAEEAGIELAQKIIKAGGGEMLKLIKAKMASDIIAEKTRKEALRKATEASSVNVTPGACC